MIDVIVSSDIDSLMQSADAAAARGVLNVDVAGTDNSTNVSLATSLTDVVGLATQELSGVDLGADQIWFWDESEGKVTGLSVGSGLSITGTTLSATGGGMVTGISKNSGANVNAANRSVLNFIEGTNITLTIVDDAGGDEVDITIDSSGGSGGTVQGTDGTYDIQPTNEGATTGNARGENSVDLQTTRTAATHVASGTKSVIGGGANNTASATEATIAGGKNNSVTSTQSTVAGGYNNTASGLGGAFVGGGASNTASGNYPPVIAGGGDNTASGNYSSILGGRNNTTSGTYASVLGGYNNTASGSYSSILGGKDHSLSGYYSVAGGKGASDSGYTQFIYADSTAANYYTPNIGNAAFFKVAGGLQVSTSAFLKEQASALADRAGVGQFWVKNNTPNEAWFTNDAGTDIRLDTRTGVSREIWIGSAAMVPRTTNGAAAATKEFATNDVMLDLLDFDTATEEGAGFSLVLPQAWDAGTIKFKVHWTADSGSGGVAWGVRANALGDSDAIDAAFGTEQVVTDTLLTAGDNHITAASSALTIGGTPSAGDLCVFEVTREVANGSDTLAVDARLIGIEIQYTETETEPTAY